MDGRNAMTIARWPLASGAKKREISYLLRKTNCTGFFKLFDKIADLFKLKAFAVDKINVDENLKFGLWSVENNVGNGEIIVISIFPPPPQCFHKPSVSRSLKVEIV